MLLEDKHDAVGSKDKEAEYAGAPRDCGVDDSAGGVGRRWCGHDSSYEVTNTWG